MTTRYIALLDGSVYSESVCHHAAWIAQRTEAPGRADACAGPPRGAGRSRTCRARSASGARTALLEELAALDAQRAKLAQATGHAILEDATAILEKDGVTEVDDAAAPGRMRRGRSREVEADARVIVIGKRGEAADFAKGHLGSNLERIVRAAIGPVFVASRAFKPIESRCWSPIDGGASAMKAVDHIARSPLFADLAVTVVTVGAETDAVRKGLGGCAGAC